jgi:hypothetical protein
MKPLHFFLFIVILPFIISLGHDVYVFYAEQNQQINVRSITNIYTEDRPGRSFELASFGFIWTNYSPDSYELMSESFDPGEWAAIQEFLKFKSTLVFAAFAIVMYFLAFLFMAFNSPKKAQKIRPRR